MSNISTGSQPSDQSRKTSGAGMVTAARDQLSDVAEQAQEATKEQMDRLSDAIRRRPLQSAGIAAGVGFVLALIARR